MAKREFKVKWADTPSDDKPMEKRQAHLMSMLREQLDSGGFVLSHTEPDGTCVYYTEEPIR